MSEGAPILRTDGSPYDSYALYITLKATIASIDDALSYLKAKQTAAIHFYSLSTAEHAHIQLG